MIFNDNKEDDDKEDFFEGNHPEPEVKKPEALKLTPDDPRYWTREESQWEHLQLPRRKNGIRLWGLVALVIIGLIVGLYIRYFSPYITEATQYGYIDSIEKRGSLFKTYEGVLIPYKELMDTTRIYDRNFVFSAADSHVAAQIKGYLKSGRPLKLEYKQYHATLPWRGASRIVVTAVDTVDASRLLPPEFAPKP